MSSNADIEDNGISQIYGFRELSTKLEEHQKNGEKGWEMNALLT